MSLAPADELDHELPKPLVLHGWQARLAWLSICALLIGCAASHATALWRGQEAIALAKLGLATPWLIGYANSLELIRLGGYLTVALVLLLRQPADLLALVSALVLAGAGAFIPSASEALVVGLGTPLPSDFSLAVSAIVCFYLIFPDGRLVPRWGWLLVCAWFTWELLALCFPTTPLNPRTWPAQAQFVRTMGWLGCGLSTQIYRYYWIASPAQRQQTRWVLFGAWVTYGTALAFALFPLVFPTLRTEPAALQQYLQFAGAARTLLMLALPLTMALAVLRYRLWNAAPLLRQTVLYITLILCIGFIYMVLIGLLGLIFRTEANPLLSFLATAVIAAVIQPLREWLQHLVHLLFYGEQANPYATLAQLGRQLEATLTTAHVLPTLVRTIAQSMRLPYVAIALRQDDTLILGAEYPYAFQPMVAQKLHRVPLSHRGEAVGELVVAPRGEALARAEQLLLADLARQASATLHALGLHQELERTLHELQQSRERLVTAREEERRQLRRDLHDGVGPTLASLIQRIDRIRSLLKRDLVEAERSLVELKALLRTTITDIRSLSYALRPPALDEFGLIGALRQSIVTMESDALQIELHLPTVLPMLSAALELAVYRIVLEALTNVLRHAQATRCHVRIEEREINGRAWLSVQIADNGLGLPAQWQTGVGLTAIRERATELGGQYRIEAQIPHGVQVVAEFPLGQRSA